MCSLRLKRGHVPRSTSITIAGAEYDGRGRGLEGSRGWKRRWIRRSCMVIFWTCAGGYTKGTGKSRDGKCDFWFFAFFWVLFTACKCKACTHGNQKKGSASGTACGSGTGFYDSTERYGMVQYGIRSIAYSVQYCRSQDAREMHRIYLPTYLGR